MTGLVNYSHLDEHRQLLNQNRYAATVVFEILDRFLSIDSVLDLGCGIGVWMQAALGKPGRLVLGMDLEAFPEEQLAVPSDAIINQAADRAVDLHRRFDLVLCLETAEHIAADRAAELVSNCVRYSEVVLFSAAIPGQGGLHHVNEQPPEYWQGLFHRAGYDVVDLVRPLIWRDTGIPAWYRQNMLLFVNRQAGFTLDLLRSEAAKICTPLHRAHPDLFEWQSEELARHKAELGEANQARAWLEQRLAHERSESLNAQLRAKELEADLTAQRAYGGRVVSQSWALMQRMRNEREGERAQLGSLGQQRAALEEARAEVRDLRSSASWRVTAPLRTLAGWLLRLKNRGGR